MKINNLNTTNNQNMKTINHHQAFGATECIASNHSIIHSFLLMMLLAFGSYGSEEATEQKNSASPSSENSAPNHLVPFIRIVPVSLNNFLQAPCDGTEVLVWNWQTATYDNPYVYFAGFGWFDHEFRYAGNYVIGAGKWGWVNSQCPVVFAPPPLPPAGNQRIGGYHMAGNPTQDPVSFETLMGFSPVIGDRVLRFTGPITEIPDPTNPSANTTVYTYTTTGWDTEPFVAPDEFVLVELVDAANVNTAPALDPIANRTVHAGEELYIQAHATDTNLPPQRLTFSLSGDSHPGMAMDPRTGLIILPTSAVAAGTILNLTVEVTDDGTPPMSDTNSFRVTVANPLVIQSMTAVDDGLELTWNSIPGQEYIVHSKRSLDQPSWDYRATVIADSALALWEDRIYRGRKPMFYSISTTYGGDCGCPTNTFTYFDSQLGRIKFTPAEGDAPASMTIKVPMSLVGTITCNPGQGHCEGEMSVELVESDSTWKLIRDEDGAQVGADMDAGGSIGSTKKDHANWSRVQGPCGTTTATSVPAVYTDTLDFSGLAIGTRERIKSGAIRVHGELKFLITTQCGANQPAFKTVTVVVDNGDDFSNTGGFDHDESDFDGDGVNGDNDAEPNDPTED